ncbi:UpxY family transcription antiterminator [Desulfobacter postgatei]|uniref:Transcription antiterminator n=1 Tax=Desulfobacter postgatei 2ac9 TaxID=879212 RepID=I5B401_9BACT|nr:UpxY family transcription antiterminator [Desulfobacter postgatei]EIM64214.1 transcription antiterminator [Desulfobacter postgatei 2ac9]
MKDNALWFALLTRSNFEQTVYSRICKKQIEAFLPSTRKPSKRKDRKLMIEAPLFPGYVFVKSSMAPVDQLPILKTLGAVRLLGNSAGPIPVPHRQIESLKLLTSVTQNLVTGSIIELKKGDPVIILEGPMAGLKGEFFEHKGKGRVIIKIDLLGRYAGVEVDSDKVEKIPDLLS